MESSAAVSMSAPPTPASTPHSRAASRASSLSSHPSPSSSAAGAHTVYGDRFIPCRARSNLALFDLDTPPTQSPYCALLSAALFWPATPDRVASSATACSSSSSSAKSPMGMPGSGNIFKFKAEAPRSAKRALFAGADKEDSLLATRGARPRKIPRSPYKILDAPDMQDDFYRSLLDWSSHDVLAVGLGSCVYLWNANRDKVTMLCDLGAEDDVCSVGWVQDGGHLAVGTYEGQVQVCNLIWSKNVNELVSTHGDTRNQVSVWRYPTMSKVVTLTGHKNRVLHLTVSSDGEVSLGELFLVLSEESGSLSCVGQTSFVRSYIR
ncbi:hypothetical protein PR202_ga01847 [Eleusine coracana subsp. coracana]|uniref:Anaphase-promoting complex subunit 4 WD40 domain-containing protein n=1 Tax=Eleusine coracana subsp. coracana TaxID=191504 RepID=A0AAV5BGQ7_ELECO|nr:hypothetical protein PR202_ga01160 [Eleusine coracana subsp. coracana]GJM86029.1 hypothetical protein PR202_ga01847 [Eleusine coracana subsp. coracana]